MEHGYYWYAKLEMLVRGYQGSFVTHAYDGRIKSVYVPCIYGTAQPSAILRGLGFTGMDQYKEYCRYYIEREEK